MPRRSVAPVWLMGLTNAVFGMYGGIIVISVPQLLSARHVPETTIAAMTAVMISPSFWTFLVSPVLDVRFSRRWYSLVTASAAALLLLLALLNLDRPIAVEALLVAGFFFATLASNIPLTYMLLVDGAAYTRHGVTGSYVADAGVSLFAGLTLGALLIRQKRRGSPNPHRIAAAEMDA